MNLGDGWADFRSLPGFDPETAEAMTEHDREVARATAEMWGDFWPSMKSILIWGAVIGAAVYIAPGMLGRYMKGRA